jgi:mono/diheme cytochrome c family protein
MKPQKSTKFTKLLLLVALVLFCGLPSLGQDVKKGKDAFVKFGCYGCHDYSGQGGNGAATGPRLIGLQLTQPAFIALLRSPARPQNMPPYTQKVMSDAQAADIYAFIKSLATSPAAKDIPLLNQIMNEVK